MGGHPCQNSPYAFHSGREDACMHTCMCLSYICTTGIGGGGGREGGAQKLRTSPNFYETPFLEGYCIYRSLVLLVIPSISDCICGYGARAPGLMLITCRLGCFYLTHTK
jgi:hypothetical protein